MKRALTLLLVLSFNTAIAANTIVAIVNNTPITYKSIETLFSTSNSYENKVDIVNQRIDRILQLQKAKELSIDPSFNDVNKALLSVAETNNISIEQLRAYPEFLFLKSEISEKISILNLQRLVTKEINISENEAINNCSIENNDKAVKQIKIAQIIISEIRLENSIDKNLEIKSFLKKLSKHISNGASFEAFAKLHSQHPSYANGGLTDWIEVIGPTLLMLDSLNINEVSKIYLTDFGFAIGIKLEERFVSRNLKQCKEKLLYLKAEKYYSNWLKKLREESYIKIYHDKLQ